MGNYRNFELTTYFIAQATCTACEENMPELQRQIDFFKKYRGLDKIYLEAHRDAFFATEEQVRMVKAKFEENGIRVEGGITTCSPIIEGEEKQRIFNTLCYNDQPMLDRLAAASELNGKVFDSFIIDDFYFTNCTCDACRAEHDAYNKDHDIEDDSWQDYRVWKMQEVSKKYMIAPAKKVNPNCKVVIKYPNWMESFQETGYDPGSQKDIFDEIYTGTETRDPYHQDQHLPRYLSFSLMRYMESMAPKRNGGGWFDPFDCQVLDYYLEQAYLTCLSKPRELMMFCFQALLDTMNIAALGMQLEKLDSLLDFLGEPIGVPCYIPNASQGEDNVQDHLGQHGFPILPTPNFEADAPIMLLTASSAYDEDIVAKVKDYVVKGGKAVVTAGFVNELLEDGLKELTSVRYRGRVATVNEYVHEKIDGRPGWDSVNAHDTVTIPIMEFRNNSTWAAPAKAQKGDETYMMFGRDTYGKGEMNVMVLPDSFSDIQKLPKEILSKLRSEMPVNGIFLEGPAGTSIFNYNNDTFVLYTYVMTRANDADVYVHVKGAKALRRIIDPRGKMAVQSSIEIAEANFDMEAANGKKDESLSIPSDMPQYIDYRTGKPYPDILPLYMNEGEAVFRLPARVGQFEGYKILR